MKRYACVALVWELYNVVAFLLMFPQFDNGNPESEKWMVRADYSHGSKI
jgi:hypothetical protein